MSLSDTLDGTLLRSVASRMCNIDKHELVDAGIMHDGVGGNDWSRFNKDPLTFILKLDDNRLDKLADLIARRLPKPPASTTASLGET